MDSRTQKLTGSDALSTQTGRLCRFLLVILTTTVIGAGTATAGPGHPANDTCFENLNGSTTGLSEYRGSVVVLNFWATWCSPCLIEIPHLVDLQQRIEKLDATVIGLTLDSGDARIIKQFWRNRLEIEPTYPLWLASVEQAADLFDVHTFPQTLLIDRDGKIRKRLIGLQTENELWNALQAYL